MEIPYFYMFHHLSMFLEIQYFHSFTVFGRAIFHIFPYLEMYLLGLSGPFHRLEIYQNIVGNVCIIMEMSLNAMVPHPHWQ